MQKAIRTFGLLFLMVAVVGCGTGSHTGYASPRETMLSDMPDAGASNAPGGEVQDKVGSYTLGSSKNKPVGSEEMFPVNISVAHVSYNDYYGMYNRYNNGQSKDKFKVVTTRDIEQQVHYEMLGKLAGVNSIAPINFMLVPDKCENIRDLCKAAGVLNTDMLLVYTLETSNKTKAVDIGPLAAVTLGFTPNRMEYVTSTAAATLIDVRTGHVFGSFEGSWTNNHNSSVWSENEIRTNLSIDTQQKAFDILVNTVCKAWPEVVSQNRYRVVSTERSYGKLTRPVKQSVVSVEHSSNDEGDGVEGNSFWD